MAAERRLDFESVKIGENLGHSPRSGSAILSGQLDAKVGQEIQAADSID
jgi:hypothetical protein